MSDVFISYRRGNVDSLAAAFLATQIEERFPVFFDRDPESLDLGDVFPPAIEDALNECRVFLAVIGSDWCSDANLQRLNQQDDWVHRELRTVLERGRRRPDDVRVVPLMLEPATIPARSSLPAEIAALLDHNGMQLAPGRISQDAQLLVTRIQGWLTGKAASADGVQHVPEILPYLCDRKDQEEALVDMGRLFDASNMLACVVHGHKWEAHDELLRRFESEGVLEDIFGRKDTGVTTYPVQLNRGKLKARLVSDALKSALKADVLGRRTATDEDLRAWFSTLLQPIVVQVQFTWSDYEEIGDALVRDLVQAWRRLLETGSPGTTIRPPQPALLWINFTYEDEQRELSHDVLFQPLPKLSSVDERHIREWVGLKKVAPFIGGRKQQLLNLPADREYSHGAGRLHMVRFADAATRILSAP